MNEENKTEQPTPHRRQEFRRKGQVFRSVEMTSAVLWMGVLFMFLIWGTSFAIGTQQLFSFFLSKSYLLKESADLSVIFLGKGLLKGALMALPLFALVFFLTLVFNLSQVGFVFSSYNIVPRFEKIDPGKALSRIFSARTIFEFAKLLVKLVLITYLIYITIKGQLPAILNTGKLSPAQMLGFSGKLAFTIGLRVGILWLFLAFLDFLYQRWEYEKKLRMSRRELKEDMRQTEGDPQIRAKIREKQRRLAMTRMMQEVPKARVVITNPTHLAVALRYDEDIMPVPRLTAKGGGAVAARIVKLARLHNVPVVENKNVARAIFYGVEIGQDIPLELYEAVAEIIAYIYSQREMKRLYER